MRAAREGGRGIGGGGGEGVSSSSSSSSNDGAAANAHTWSTHCPPAHPPTHPACLPRLVWVCWQHPNMPWDDTELWVGEVAGDGSVGGARRVAGGAGTSVQQPQWSAGGVLHFVSDAPGGWWNVQRVGEGGAVEEVCPMQAEVGGPAWLFGNR